MRARIVGWAYVPRPGEDPRGPYSSHDEAIRAAETSAVAAGADRDGWTWERAVHEVEARMPDGGRALDRYGDDLVEVVDVYYWCAPDDYDGAYAPRVEPIIEVTP